MKKLKPIFYFFILLPCLIILTAAGEIKAQQGGFIPNPGVNNPVRAISLQPDGKIIIGGAFSSVGGQSRTAAARLNSDGTLDTTFQNPNITAGSVSAVAIQPDGKILVGGDFRFVGGQERNNLARLNADGSLDTGFNALVNKYISAIALQPDGKILIGGEFTAVSGLTRNRIARLNADGTLDTTFQDSGVDSTIPSTINVYIIVLQPDGKALIGGFFNIVGGQPRAAVARLNNDGTLDTTFQDVGALGGTGTTVNHNGNETTVNSLAAQPDGKVLIGGTFSTINGQTRNNLARLNSNGSIDMSFGNPNVNNGTSNSFLNELDLQPDGKILIGGFFSSVGGQTRNKVARVNADGSVDSTFNDPNVSDGSVVAIKVQPDGKTLVGGFFTLVGGRTRRNLTRLTDAGGLDVPSPVTFTVTKTADTSDGVCNSDCSLREAIVAANLSESDDTIEFDPNLFNNPQTITLTSGQLAVCNAGSLTVNGTNANLLTISGNNQSRVFRIYSGATGTLNNLKITNGNPISSVGGCPPGNSFSVGGAGIENQGTLFINNSIITGNSTINSGGGLSNVYGTVTIRNSIIANNQANECGGIINIGISEVNIGSLTLINSQVSGNTSTFEFGNNGGGGIGNLSGATLSIINSTISSNNAFNGGGIYNKAATVNLVNATIAFNQASSNGGGVLNVTSPASTLNAQNSIISNNLAGSAPDVSGSLISQGYNLIKNTSGTNIAGISTGNILGQDPQLMALSNYGGLTQTHALATNSPAIDKGSAVSGINSDQRVLPRPYDFPLISNAPGGNGSDIGAFELQGIVNKAPFDFDGDGRTDISIFRPSVGEWWYLRSSDGGNYAAQFGNSTDKLVPGDYTGDGRADIAIWRPSTGEWFILRSEDGSYYSYPFGTSGDIPAVGDFDADGKADSAVFRPSDTTWYIRRSSDGGFTIEQFGASGDAPAVADYDGDGKSDIAIWRASVGEWWIKKSSNSSVVAFQFGISADKPVQGDYTGDGKADVAIYRPSSGEWFILRSEDFSYYSYPFGANGDVPAPGDYDGDGKFDATVFRPSGSTWYVQRSTAGTLIQNFGQSGDMPVPNAFVP